MARALGLLAVTSVYAFTHDESAACYASRYPDLHARFCATDRCDTQALHDHYKNEGATEGRRWGCGSRFDAVSDLHVARQGASPDSGPQRLEPLCAALSYFVELAPTGELQLDRILKQRASEGHWVPQSGKPRFYPNNFTVINDLYISESTSKSPYEGFKFPRFGETLWDSYRSNAQRMSGAIGEHAIKALGGERPKLILEAGSFIGSGALHAWQPLLDPAGGILICIDSWLGDINMRLGKHFQRWMALENGFPSLGKVFMARVLASGHSDKVFPLSVPAMLGFKLIYLLGYRVDLIYVDSAHERGETLFETYMAWELLRPGGVLMGDDYKGFPAVKRDIDLFAKCVGLTLTFLPDGNTWMLVKPSGL